MTLTDWYEFLDKTSKEAKIIFDLLGTGWRLALPKHPYNDSTLCYIVREAKLANCALQPKYLVYTEDQLTQLGILPKCPVLKELETIPKWASDDILPLVHYDYYNLIF